MACREGAAFRFLQYDNSMLASDGRHGSVTTGNATIPYGRLTAGSYCAARLAVERTFQDEQLGEDRGHRTIVLY